MSGTDFHNGELCKVFFMLGEDQWHGFLTESIWVKHKGQAKYEVMNSPFFVKGVSCRDIILAYESDARLVFDKVVISSGNSTYRILLKHDINSSTVENYWLPLQELGCTFEENRELKLIMLAVDIPASVDIHQAYNLLQEGEQAGVWEFEEGHCGAAGTLS